jgi:hypothetical protein
MRLSTAWMPRSSYRMRRRGKTCTEWGECHDMVAMCVQRDTDATAKTMANYTLPYERLYFTGQEHSGLPAVELMVHERKTDSSWQVSRARTSSKPWTALTTAAIGGTRMVQHSGDGGRGAALPRQIVVL